MADRILVPFDESDPAEAALIYALERFPDGEILVLNALDLDERTASVRFEGEARTDVGALEAERREELAAVVDRIRSRADDRGQDLTVRVISGPPARRIVSFAEDRDVDHVVIGSHGRTGASRILLGSVAESVVRRAPVPVTVVR